MEQIKITPTDIFKEHAQSVQFKSKLGSHGLFEQTKRNERFYSGDQWHGAKVGNDRPLVRHNVIKRIAEYKQSMITSAPISVNYSADGIPNTVGLRSFKDEDGTKDKFDVAKEELASGQQDALNEFDEPTKINFVMEALSEYFKTTAERLKLDELKSISMKNAYVSGTAVAYTYWDNEILTGLYADDNKETPIKGDIQTEIIDIENVDFGNEQELDVQKQPYIIISQRKTVADVKREAKINGINAKDIEQIKADSDHNFMSGDRAENEQSESNKCLVLTKLWKEWAENGISYTIKAIKVCDKVVVKKEWDLGLRYYPLAVFRWDTLRNCAYGESEVTYLIPNQIAINRMLTANVWAIMQVGMPIMVVNSDVIHQPVTNNPGQIIRFTGNAEDFNNCIRYVTPPAFSAQLENNIQSLINNTLDMAGANAPALGNINPDNATAIVAVREAATMPLQPFKTRFYQFIEDISRIWAEFWVQYYGGRQLKVNDAQGTYYIPFNGDEYKNLIISSVVDVGDANLWSEVQAIQTLNNLYSMQAINLVQYLERVPKGSIPNVTGLLKEVKQAQEQQAQRQTPMQAEEVLSQLSPEEQEMFNQLPPEQQEQMLMESQAMYAQTVEGGVTE